MPFVRDPCGIVCLIFTYLAVFYADYVVMRWIIIITFRDRCIFNLFWPLRESNRFLFASFYGPLHVILFNTIVFLLVMSHLKAVFLDPGTGE